MLATPGVATRDACASNPLTTQAIGYRDVASAAGVENIWQGYGFGAGVAAEDLDVDGDVDILVLNAAGTANRLFENVGDRDGLGYPVFIERTTSAGFVDLGNSKGVVCADYNNDGLPDIVVTNYDETIDRRPVTPGYRSSITLYRNDGDLRFTDVTDEAGLFIQEIAAYGVSAGDIDNDGWLDLYVCNRGGIDDIRKRGGGYNLLYRNRGDGTFENISESSGIADVFDATSANLTFQSGFFDYDDDGDVDVYLATDKLGGNQLYRNNGDLTFTNVSSGSGADIYMNGMCVAFGDYDNDRDLDVFITNTPQGHSLLRNNGNGTFTDVAWDAGVAAGRIGWGARWMDADHDTNVDLYVVHFGIPDDRNALYENRANGTFVDIASSAGCTNPADGYGLAEADFDLDGGPDFVVTNSDDACGLFLHDGVATGWLRVRLIGTTSNRDAVGARLLLHGGGVTQMREVVAGDSYLSHSALEQHFGLGATSPQRLEIRWPTGVVETLEGSGVLRVKRRYRIVEGHGIQTGTLLVDHDAQSSAGVVQLTWETVQWPDDVGFRVERSLVVDGAPQAPEVLAEVSDAGRWHRYTDVVSGEPTQARVYRYAVHVMHADGSASPFFVSADVAVVPTAVELRDMQIAATHRGVELRWRLTDASRTEAGAVVVQRAPAPTGPWATLHTLEPARDMQFIDTNVQVARDYWYRLLLEARDGSRAATLAIGVRVPSGSTPHAALAPPVESPDGGPVRLSFSLPRRADVRLDIVDARGRRIDTLVRGPRDAGTHVVAWQRASDGVHVPRGVYFVQLRAGAFNASRKLVLLH